MSHTSHYNKTAPARKKRKSRWGGADEKVNLPSNTALVTKDLSADQTEAFLFRLKLQALNQQMMNPRGPSVVRVVLSARCGLFVLREQQHSPGKHDFCLFDWCLTYVALFGTAYVEELREKGPLSPSPEPVYDENGKRTNSREQRELAKLAAKKQALIATVCLRRRALYCVCGWVSAI